MRRAFYASVNRWIKIAPYEAFRPRQNSADGLEQLELLLRHNRRCARISGAGGGGFMIFLADPMRRIRLADELRSFE
jgi:hypothetical protein